MPYIKQSDRERLATLPIPETPGELNYLITELCLKYIGDKKNYQRINDVMGALHCAGLEFYRKLAAPYEDTKIAENGDVYPEN